MSENNCILELKEVSKAFPGVVALDRVCLKVQQGSVHAIVGENGAGKSTLMKIILGMYHHDSGESYYRGEKVNFQHPNEALNAGIAMIHQELSSALELSVAQNIFLGREITFGKSQLIKKKQMTEHTRDLLKQLGILDIDPDTKMKYLSVAKQQMCEIAKAISYNADLMLMDEPTSAIADQDVLKLFNLIRDLVKRNKTVIYVTHKLDELFSITDYISVFRDGRHIATVPTKSTTREDLIHLMVGREISELFPKEAVDIGEPLLRVEGLSRDGEFDNVSFHVRSGEILGVAGLMGAGRSEIMETIFGVRKKSAGKVFVHGKEIQIRSPGDAIRNGMAFLTEDRKNSGCFLPLSVRVNTFIASINRHSGRLFVNWKKTVESANNMVKALAIKTTSLEEKVSNLSGGNQQKVLVGR